MNINIYNHSTPLQKASIIKRPSLSCKTPYVADILILENNINTLAHTPALGCCGLNDKGANVLVKAMTNPKKCTHSVELALFNDILVGTNPKLAETLVENSIKNNLIPSLENIISYKREKTFKNSRFDFHGFDFNNNEFIMEVKSVPIANSDNIAYFPDGFRKSKKDTISPRALKHVNELKQIKLESPHIRCILCFVIQRSDAKAFMISHDDPIYRNAVFDAINNGVEVIPIVIQWNEQGQAFFKQTFDNVL